MSEIIYGQEGRLKIKEGIDKLANAVKVTLGPKGRNVILNKRFGSPSVTKDGVSVARDIELEDGLESIGAKMVKDVASKTADIAGDGTTTATVLAQKLYNDGIKLIQAGFNPIELKKGIDKATEAIVQELDKLSKELVNEQDFIRIATVSANNDDEIGRLVGEAFIKAGKNGLVTVENSKNNKSFLDVSDGVSIDRGFISPYFANTDKQEIEFDAPYILLCTHEINDVRELIPLLEEVSVKGSSLLIIAKDLNEVTLNTLVVNKVQNGLKVGAIRCPGFGESSIEMMKDLAVLTGGVVVDGTTVKLADASLAYMGRCRKSIINTSRTELIGSAGSKEAIQNRINELTLLMNTMESEYDKNKVVKRISSLGTGVCTIYIGANSEVEQKEKRDRYDDALNAVKSALEEGIIAGGGCTFLHISNKLRNLKGKTAAENVGISLVMDSIKEPFRQILRNGEMEYEFYIKKLQGKKYGIGLNLISGKMENLIDSGIVDPAKVARLAIQNSSSIVGTLLTTECVVY